MSKRKAITLLSIVSVLVAFVLVMTFIRFPIGIKNYNSAIGAIEPDYDLQGGTAYTLTLSEDNEEEVKDINQVVDTLEYRLSELGYTLYTVKAVKSTDETVKDYDIRIETKTTSTLANDIAVVAAYGEIKLYGGTSANPTTEILEDVDAIADAQYLGVQVNGTTPYYPVSITFTQEGYDGLMELMDAVESGSSYYLEIKLGETVLLSGSSAITKEYFNKKSLPVTLTDETAAKQMALQIRTGGLAYHYEISDPETITSNFGTSVDTKSVIIIGALVLLVMAALVVLYRGFGVIGSLSMLLFILAETWMLIAVPNLVVSMGSVIGIIFATILTAVGIAYLLNTINTEYANSEKTVMAAIKKGFKDTLKPILSAGVVSGILAVLLLLFSTGVLKGFASTFGIGVVVGLITTLLFTRMYTALILPLVENKEKFLNLKREDA